MSDLLNSRPDVDVCLMEATKALMMADVLQLYDENLEGNDVPTFAWLLFARDTSLDPQAFFLNHLDPVGDSHGLEMVCVTAFMKFSNNLKKLGCDFLNITI